MTRHDLVHAITHNHGDLPGIAFDLQVSVPDAFKRICDEQLMSLLTMARRQSGGFLPRSAVFHSRVMSLAEWYSEEALE